MATIVNLDEFASFLQVSLVDDTATLLLDLAEALVIAEIGTGPWPAIAKTTVLTAAGRAYRNPSGGNMLVAGRFTLGLNPEEMGVYLTSEERIRLLRPSGASSPRGVFPDAESWPDPPRPRVYRLGPY